MNPWMLLGGGILWIASIALSANYWGNVQRGLEKAAWTTKENEDLKAANKKIADLSAAARAQEAEHQQRIADIATNITQEEVRHEAERLRAVAGARALVLRNQPACPAGPGGGASGSTVAGAGGGDGPSVCELPAETVRDLESLVHDADRDVRQLGHAQAVIVEDRRLCNIPLSNQPKGDTP